MTSRPLSSTASVPHSCRRVGGLSGKVAARRIPQRRKVLGIALESSDVMTKVIRCTCGFLARGTDPGEAADALAAHLRADHPELAGSVRREDLESMAEEA